MISAEGRRIAWLLRSFSALGLIVVAVTLTTVGKTLSHVRAERSHASAQKARLDAEADELDRRTTDARKEIQSYLNQTMSPTTYQGASFRLASYVRSLIASNPDTSLTAVLREFAASTSTLTQLSQQSRDWRANYDSVTADTANQVTVGKARACLTRIRYAVDDFVGRMRLTDAVEYNKWKSLTGDEADRLARQILEKQGRIQSMDTVDFKRQLAEFAGMVEMLNGEEQADRLSDLRENQLQPAVKRLHRFIDAFSVDQSATESLHKDVNELGDIVIGSNAGVGGASQGNLLSLRKTILELRSTRDSLTVADSTLFQQIDALKGRHTKTSEAFGIALAQQAEDDLAAGWRRLLFSASASSLAFLFLASMISNAIKSQVRAVQSARAEAEEGRQMTHRLMLEHQATAAELAARERRLRTLNDSSSVGVFECDPSGIVVYADSQWLKISGMSPSTVPGSLWEPTIHDNDARVYAGWQDACCEGRTFHCEFRFVPAPDEIRWISARVAGLFSDEGLIGTVGTFEDITERKNAEAVLDQLNKQLMNASRHAGMAEVATGVLHNVGNVLNSVNVSSTLLLDGIKNSAVAKVGRVVEMIQAHQNDLGEFITKDAKGSMVPAFLAQLAKVLEDERTGFVTELSHLQKNVEHIIEIVKSQQTYAKSGNVLGPICPSEMIEDALRIHKTGIARHNVTVCRELADVPKVSSDRHKVLQILVNLVGNAKQAMRESAVRTMTVKLEDNGAFVRMSVRDTGSGIASENMTRIFSNGFTTKKDGHGFGLHSSALLAKELGGSLHVDSAGPGQGALFYLDLPKVFSPHATTDEPQNSLPAAH